MTFFIVFCSGERQWWDDIGKTEMEDKGKSDQNKESNIETA